jgi:hypothetical protein
MARLRSSYGTDASVDNLAVYEVVLGNRLPLRKTGGLFKDARLASSLLLEMVQKVNEESIPVQLQHDTSTTPFGRLFSATNYGEEARGLIAIDQTAHADLVAKMDNGTIDQVSVGMVNTKLLCSRCGFNYADPKAYEYRYDLTCDKEHQIGVDGTHVEVSGLDSFFEVSLVGQGAVRGARVIGPSESAFKDNARLAASSAATGDAIATHLTATPAEPDEDDMLNAADFTTQLTSATEGRVRAETNLATVTTERDTARTELATTQAAVTTLTGERDTLATNLTAAETARDTAVAERDAVLVVLNSEVSAVLTACGKNTDEIAAAVKDKDATALLSILQDHRAQFAAVIPAGGASKPADTIASAFVRKGTGAFRSPTRA